MSIIVYYDSAIQEGFEMLVRDISGARNNLRRGRSAAGLQARRASLGAQKTPFAGGDDSTRYNPYAPTLLRVQNGHRDAEGYACEAFDQADQDLEAAQSLCEVGAYQFLRDGKCDEEISGTQERFENCLRLAEQQATSLLAEARKENHEDEHHQPMDQDLQMDDKMCVETLVADVAQITVAQFGLAEMGTIEVDDESDASSIHIDLTAFRSARRI